MRDSRKIALGLLAAVLSGPIVLTSAWVLAAVAGASLPGNWPGAPAATEAHCAGGVTMPAFADCRETLARGLKRIGGM